MKRFIVVLLVALLTLSSFATVAFAAEGSAAASVSSSQTVKPGDTVTLTVGVTGTFSNYEMKVSAASGLTITAITGVTANVGTGKVAYSSGVNVTESYFNVTVKVADDAAPGSYVVTATPTYGSMIVDPAEDTEDGVVDGRVRVALAAGSATLTIACDHAWGPWTEVKPATCTEEGEESRTCSACGEVETRKTPKVAHSWGAWTEVEAASCTKMGKEVRECSVCGEKEYRDVAKLEHSWVTEWAKDEHNHWHECSVCGEKKDVEAHTMTWIVDKPANYEQEGLKHEECVICGQHGKTEKIPQWIKDPDIDDEPQTGDITPTVNFGSVVTVVLAMFCVVALVFKRRTVK